MKKRIATLLAVTLLTAWLLPSAALAAEKSEIVYVNLRSGGDLDEIHIVNRFESNTSESIVDYGAYYKVTNLSDTSALEQSADSVRLTVSNGTLFYQGDPISATLPWRFQVSYTLNGAPARAEDLSGADGALQMQLSIGPGDENLSAFYEHYALTMTVTLDGNHCTNIVADSATIANSGTDRLLNYTILPSPDVTYTVTADVTQFSMPDISINAVPMGMDVDIDTSEIDDKLDELQSGVSQLSSGSARVAGGASSLKGGAAELQSGTVTLAEGTESLVTGAGQFSAGLDEAKSGSAQLAAASAQLVAAIDGIESQTDGSQDISIGEMRAICNQMVAACDALDGALGELQKQLSGLVAAAQALETKAGELCDRIDQLTVSHADISLLNQLLQRAAGNSDVTTHLAAEIAALRRVLDNASGLNGQLEALKTCAQENLSLAQSLSGPLTALDGQITSARTQLSQSKTALQSVLGLLDAMEANGASSGDGVGATTFATIRQMNDGIQALDSGLGELQTSFGLLSAGISSVDAGVDSLATGADTLLSGASSLSSGANSLKGGVNELESGTGDMNAQVEEGVDDAISSITGGDFEPVSYADERNAVDAVQFVIRVPGVKEAEEPEAPVAEEPEKGFFDKLLDLFR